MTRKTAFETVERHAVSLLLLPVLETFQSFLTIKLNADGKITV